MSGTQVKGGGGGRAYWTLQRCNHFPQEALMMLVVPTRVSRMSIVLSRFVWGADTFNAGGDSSPQLLRICYNVHESFATFGEIRGRRTSERGTRGRERAQHLDQPVREKSRPFIGIRRFLPDVSSSLRDGTAAYGRRLEEIEYAVVAVVVALAYRCSLVMVASSHLELGRNIARAQNFILRLSCRVRKKTTPHKMLSERPARF